MYYTIYKITNKINNREYIGCHKTKNLDDGYMGSGKYIKRSISIHGVENFFKEILYIFDNSEEMLLKEKELVNREYLNNNLTYNIKLGGNGGFDYINDNGIGGFGGYNHSQESKEKIKIGSTGRKLTEKTKRLISESNKITNASRGEKVSKALTGKKKTKEHRDNISKALRGKRKPLSEETKEKIRQAALKRYSKK